QATGCAAWPSPSPGCAARAPRHPRGCGRRAVRAVLRVLAPLLGIVLATVGVLVVIEVVAAWVLPEQEGGLLVPWPEWGAVLAGLSWTDSPVRGTAIGVAVVGLLLVLVALTARRADLRLVAP